MHEINTSSNCLVKQMLGQLVEQLNNCQHFLTKLTNRLTYHFFRFRNVDFAFHNMFYYIRKWEPFHDILTFYSTPYERDFWKIWRKVNDVIIYLFMKRKGNTAWRSRNGQMIKARQIRLLHGTVMLDYYLRRTMQKI